MNVTKNKENAYKLGEYTKVKAKIEVKITDKSLVKNKVGRLNAIAGKSLVKDRVKRPAKLDDKSLNITVEVLRNVAKSETIIVKKLETLMISKTRVLITFNLNNLALISPLFAFF